MHTSELQPVVERKISSKRAILIFATNAESSFLVAAPSSTLLQRSANRREQIVSPQLAATGDEFTNIRTCNKNITLGLCLMLWSNALGYEYEKKYFFFLNLR